MKKFLLLPFTALVLTACAKKEDKTDESIPEYALKLQKAEWLLGNWGNTTPEGRLVENWRKVNEVQFNGESYFIVKNDTVFAETVVLNQYDDKVAYTVTVPNQNDAKPVRFDLTSITDNEMVFENPEHDFPNKIVYTQVKPDSLVAIIYGTKKGSPASETFAMKRIK